jgi:arylsulfatase A-like enzyme
MKSFHIAFSILCVAIFSPPSQAAEVARPNVLFIYADDWGWGDLACHGHPHLQTPNLDRIAKEGTDFHQFTVGNPVCSPSRTAIVTGQYPARHSVHQHFAGHAENVARGMPDWLDPKATLLPRLMKQAGYATAHFGKWHLSGQGAGIEAPLPSEYGYDAAAVWTGPGADVFTGSSVEKMTGDAHDKQGAAFLTIAATDHVLRFIREAKNKPFYINYWIHETHHLVAATDEDKKAYPDTAEPQRTYYSAITRADKQIGRVLALLDELKLADNTLIVFSSDNGPENSMEKPTQKLYHSVGDTGGLRGRKRSLYLGGVNVPFLVRWPGQVPAGRVDKTSVITGVDVMPTLLAATGVTAPSDWEPDGVNILATFKGQPLQRETSIFWEWRGPHAQPADWPTHAVRSGDYTLLLDETAGRTELYNVIEDRAQANNLADTQRDQVTAMKVELTTWRTTLPPFLQSPPPAESRAKAPTKKSAPVTNQDRAAIFKRWDTNHDNALTLEEYTAAIRTKDVAPTRFKAFDQNSDAKLSVDEFVKP